MTYKSTGFSNNDLNDNNEYHSRIWICHITFYYDNDYQTGVCNITNIYVCVTHNTLILYFIYYLYFTYKYDD